MPQNCIAPRPEENGEAMVQGLTDMSETQRKSVLVNSQPGLQLSMYPITLKVSLSLSLTLKRESVLFTFFFKFLLSFGVLHAQKYLINKYYSLFSSSSSLVVG